jgi:hypothetical protein
VIHQGDTCEWDHTGGRRGRRKGTMRCLPKRGIILRRERASASWEVRTAKRRTRYPPGGKAGERVNWLATVWVHCRYIGWANYGNHAHNTQTYRVVRRRYHVIPLARGAGEDARREPIGPAVVISEELQQSRPQSAPRPTPQTMHQEKTLQAIAGLSLRADKLQEEVLVLPPVLVEAVRPIVTRSRYIRE